MKTIYRNLLLYGILLIFISSIQTADTTPSSAKATSTTYIMSSSSTQGLRAELEKLKAKDIAIYDEVGIAIFSSTDSDFKAKASKIKDVSAIMKDVKVQRIKPKSATARFDPTTMKKSSVSAQNVVSNDPLVELQWGLDAIHALEAHKAGYTGKGVRVAILDSGFDLDHPDVKPNTDFSSSKNFIAGETLQYVPTDPDDIFAHGTFVAGIVAAADNGIGIVGVAPKAKLILVKVLKDISDEREDLSVVIPGFLHAIKERADVINMSFGTIFPAGDADLPAATAIWTALTTYAHKKGVTVIASAANEEFNFETDPRIIYPVAAPYVIGVSATAPRGWILSPERTNLDNIASYSNVGRPEVDLSAPGGDFIWPDETRIPVAGFNAPIWAYDMVVGPNFDNKWSLAAGTSFSSPHTAGVAALIIGKYKGKITPDQVEKILKESADDLGKPGVDTYYGYGRINALRALTSCKK